MKWIIKRLHLNSICSNSRFFRCFMALCDDDADAGILSFIGDIYDCSIDPARWTPTLERISRRVNACEAAITLHDTVNPQFAIKIGWNNNPEFVDVMQKNFALNPFIHACWYSEIDNPFSAFSFYGEQDLKMSDWFQRCMQRFGYGDVALTVIARTARHFGGSSFLRMDDQPNYGPAGPIVPEPSRTTHSSRRCNCRSS